MQPAIIEPRCGLQSLRGRGVHAPVCVQAAQRCLVSHGAKGTRVLYARLPVLQVRRELVALYTADCIRRLAMEVVVPLLTARARAGLVHVRQRRLKAETGDAPDAADMAAVECLARDDYDGEGCGHR